MCLCNFDFVICCAFEKCELVYKQIKYITILAIKMIYCQNCDIFD